MSEAKRAFFSDIKFPGMYHAVLVRSPARRGRLAEVRSPELPEGYFLFTAADIPGKNSVEMNGGSVPVLAEGTVSYIGQPVGIVAGPDCEIALGLAEMAEVIVEDDLDAALPPATERIAQEGDVSPFFEDEAAASDAPKSGSGANAGSGGPKADGAGGGEGEEGPAQGEGPGGGGTAESPAPLDGAGGLDAPGSAGASSPPDAAPQEAAEDEELVITESLAEIAVSECFAHEHSGAAVKYKKDRMEVHVATSWPFHARMAVAAALSLSPSKIAVIPAGIAPSNKGRMFASSLAAVQAALASFLCKKPVKLVLSRDEELRYSAKSPPARIRIRSAAAPSGKIVSLQADIEVNSGSGMPFADEIAARMEAASAGLYDIENSKTAVRLVPSSLPPMMSIGFGEREAFLALESHIDIVARQLNALPQEVREANIADAGHSSLLKAVCDASGFARKYSAYESLNRRREGAKDGPLRGIGLSLGYQGSGFLSAWPEGVQYSAEITMETTGAVRVKCGSCSPSIKEIICSTVSELLEIDKGLVSLVDADPEDASFSGPGILSSSVAIVAPLVSKCCASLQKQRFRNPLPITVKKTYKPAKPGGDTAQASPFVSCTPGACVAELELNPLDFSIRTRGLWIACDAGKILDKRNAERTLKRAARESLAALLAETAKIEGDAFRSPARFGGGSPAFLPAAEPEILLLESKEMPCGIGAIARNLLPGAFCSAIEQMTRKSEIKLPATAKYLYGCLAGSV